LPPVNGLSQQMSLLLGGKLAPFLATDRKISYRLCSSPLFFSQHISTDGRHSLAAIERR